MIRLLEAGHETQTTVRDLVRANDVRAMVSQGGVRQAGQRLMVFRADLNADGGWAEAVAGCDYVLHVASPFPSTVPKDENERIAPARDGALGWVPRSPQDAVLATAQSLSELGLLKNRPSDNGGRSVLEVAAHHAQDGFDMAKK